MIVKSRLPGFDGANAWLNSEPLASAELDGKVVAVQFWTYTCINWLRTLPYTRAWADAYGAHGLVVVGVHTPEFSVEHEIENVRSAARNLGVEYPIAVDHDYEVWNAFANHYWPALYIADAKGRIRYHHFGEGEYEKSETVIRQLLDDTGAVLPEMHAPVETHGMEVGTDWSHVQSPETYVGLGRSDGFASPEAAAFEEPAEYTIPSRVHLNQWALAGNWTLGPEMAVSPTPNGRIAYRFHARDLNLILVPPDGTPARVRVRLDGDAPGDAHGLDVDEAGDGTISEPRLYQLIRQNDLITDRTFEIELLDPGASALCFTFG